MSAALAAARTTEPDHWEDGADDIQRLQRGLSTLVDRGIPLSNRSTLHTQGLEALDDDAELHEALKDLFMVAWCGVAAASNHAGVEMLVPPTTNQSRLSKLGISLGARAMDAATAGMSDATTTQMAVRVEVVVDKYLRDDLKFLRSKLTDIWQVITHRDFAASVQRLREAGSKGLPAVEDALGAHLDFLGRSLKGIVATTESKARRWKVGLSSSAATAALAQGSHLYSVDFEPVPFVAALAAGIWIPPLERALKGRTAPKRITRGIRRGVEIQAVSY